MYLLRLRLRLLLLFFCFVFNGTRASSTSVVSVVSKLRRPSAVCIVRPTRRGLGRTFRFLEPNAATFGGHLLLVCGSIPFFNGPLISTATASPIGVIPEGDSPGHCRPGTLPVCGGVAAPLALRGALSLFKPQSVLLEGLLRDTLPHESPRVQGTARAVVRVIAVRLGGRG